MRRRECRISGLSCQEQNPEPAELRIGPTSTRPDHRTFPRLVIVPSYRDGAAPSNAGFASKRPPRGRIIRLTALFVLKHLAGWDEGAGNRTRERDISMPLIAKSPSQYLIDLVCALGDQWQGWMAMCRCPAHADTNPSLALHQGDPTCLPLLRSRHALPSKCNVLVSRTPLNHRSRAAPNSGCG